MTSYNDIEILVRIGEYKIGTDARSDEALAKNDAIIEFQKQTGDTAQWEQVQTTLSELAS